MSIVFLVFLTVAVTEGVGDILDLVHRALLGTITIIQCLYPYEGIPLSTVWGILRR